MQAEQTETVSKQEVLHASEESAPISTDMKVDNVKRTDEGTEDSAEAKNDNKDVQESAEKDDIVAKDSTDEQEETTGEITNEEVSLEFPLMKCKKLNLCSFVHILLLDSQSSN